MTASARVDLATETLWLIRWHDRQGRVLSAIRMSREGATRCALAKYAHTGRRPLVYRVNVDWLEPEHVDLGDGPPLTRKAQAAEQRSAERAERFARLQAEWAGVTLDGRRGVPAPGDDEERDNGGDAECVRPAEGTRVERLPPGPPDPADAVRD